LTGVIHICFFDFPQDRHVSHGRADQHILKLLVVEGSEEGGGQSHLSIEEPSLVVETLSLFFDVWQSPLVIEHH
jgi:hypothetical protein